MTNYKQRYIVYLFSIGMAILFFLNAFKPVMEFSLLDVLSVKNLIGIGLFYTAIKIWKRQVDYD